MRIEGIFSEILATSKCGRIAIVAHEGVINKLPITYPNNCTYGIIWVVNMPGVPNRNINSIEKRGIFNELYI